MKEIVLDNGDVALVDDVDFEQVNALTWRCLFNKARNRKDAVTDIDRQLVYMHRFIAGEHAGPVDHHDGNTLNNQRHNLRPCTRSQNGGNRKTQKHSSRFKGVTFYKRDQRWVAHVSLGDGKPKHLGYFDDEIDAARAYNEAAQKVYGEFAKLNQI